MFPLRQPSIQTSWSISNCCVGYLLCRFADRTPPNNLLSTSYVLFLVFHLDWLCSQGSSNSRALLACGRFATCVSLLINYWTVRKCNAFWSEFIVLPAATCQVGSAGWTRLTWNPRPWMSMVFGTKIISNRDFKRNPGQSQGPLAIVLLLFLLRGALMNARGLSIGNTFSERRFGNHQPSITSIKYISGFENSIWEGLKLNNGLTRFVCCISFLAGPIVRAIIMDLVHSESWRDLSWNQLCKGAWLHESKEMRGRWNSLQSLSMFAWSGSAALGQHSRPFSYAVCCWHS